MLAKLFTSSADPTKISLTVKGFLVLMAPVIMTVLGLTETEFGGVVELIEKIVFFGASFIGAGITLYGTIRKARLGRWVHPDAERVNS